MTTAEPVDVESAWITLADRVSEVRAGSPLARVTILVPTPASGLDVIRRLAREAARGGGQGIANVRAVTVDQLATEIFLLVDAARSRKPLTPMVRQAAAAGLLAVEPGRFDYCADRPVTAQALARCSATLDGIELDPTGAPPVVSEVHRAHQAVTARLEGGFWSRHEALTTAAERIAAGKAGDIGTVLAFALPTATEPATAAVLEALGLDDSDVLNAGRPDLAGAHWTSASDPEDEARAAARAVASWLAGGAPGHRIGVFWSSGEIYRPLVARRLQDAGIEFNGPAPVQLVDTPMARSVLRLLDHLPAPGELLSVRPLLDAIAEGLVRHRDLPLPSSAACERLWVNPVSTEDDDAEPVADPGDQGTAAAEDRAAEKKRKRREAQREFDAFHQALSAQLHEVGQAGSWSAASEVLLRLVDDFLTATGPEEPTRAAARTMLRDALTDLADLDGCGSTPESRTVAHTVQEVITAHRSRTGRIGTGVTTGSLGDALGRDIDHAVFLGLADGLVPVHAREDALLPEDVRRRTEGLPELDERVRRQRELFEAALSVVPAPLLLQPRGSLRESPTYLPSRWLPALLGRDEPETAIPSAVAALRDSAGWATDETPQPATAQELRQQWLTVRGHHPGDLDSEHLNRALEIRADRRRGRFTRYTGHAGPAALPEDFLNRPVSPTALEEWVNNPFGYFVTKVLGAELFADRELAQHIDPLTKGNILHEALEHHANQALADGALPPVEHLLGEAERIMARERNEYWIEDLWQHHRAEMLEQLRETHAHLKDQHAGGWGLNAPEVDFGEDPEIALDLPDGTVLRFRGKVDRVDRHEDGTMRVVDYKSGRRDKFKAITPEDPTAGGTKFQLPVYGLFARSLGGADVRAEYWFLGAPGEPVGYELTDDVVDALRADAHGIVTALRAGIFPHRPESERYTNVTTVCGHRDVTTLWEKLQDAPELGPHLVLLTQEETR
ncbi:PD-(D/E)XK nuclease family protein [Kocuria sp. CNJ-770]|uniref:PD-(D/E)XK nuclease family protein n=1 Tax=Kocuria sp. CNJ-770 TaxID=1904964 RepID=UPI001300DE01|nr:PD-(D/E)XK nuclease family protein [Kocuria sp. CNJ-770]